MSNSKPYERKSDSSSKIIIAGEIGPQTLVSFIQSYQGGTVMLSSLGGDIGSMLGIFDHIKQFEDTVVFATGICASAAAVLLQAADTRIMSRDAVLQFIPPPENRDVDPPRWFLHSNLANLVRERTGMALPESYDLFDSQMISAERALQLNLIDKIEGRPDDYVNPDLDTAWIGIGDTVIEGDRLPDSEESPAEEPGDNNGNR